MNKRSNKISFMPTPPKRRGQQLNKYSQILDFLSNLVNIRESTSQEYQNTQRETSPGGRRSTDTTDYIDLIDDWYSLSPREKDVTRLTCEGCTNDQIAYRLGIGSGTIKMYHQKIFLKMNVRSKVDLRMKFYGFNFNRYTSD